MKRRLGVAEETVRIKKERLEEAEKEYDEEHRTFTTFSKRLEEKWEQRFDELAQLAAAAGVQSEDITAIRMRPWRAVEQVAAVAAVAQHQQAEPAADEPAADEPAAEEPAAHEPAVDEPPADEPAAGAPAADEPGADEDDEGPDAMDEWGIQTRGERLEDLRHCRCVGCGKHHPSRMDFVLEDIDSYDEHGEPDRSGWVLRYDDLEMGLCIRCNEIDGLWEAVQEGTATKYGEEGWQRLRQRSKRSRALARDQADFGLPQSDCPRWVLGE